MKHLSIILLIYFSAPSIYGQLSIEKQVISPYGLMSEGSIRMEATLGEVVIFSFEGQQLIINQGFHTGGNAESTPVIEINQLSIDVQVYPNPTSDVVYIDYDDPEKLITGVSICNSQGQMVIHKQIQQVNNKPIHLNHLPSGMYGVIVHSDHGMRFTTWVSLKK